MIPYDRARMDSVELRPFQAAIEATEEAVLNALFLGFMFAFAVKAPLWPFHRWLPDAAVEITPGTPVRYLPYASFGLV